MLTSVTTTLACTLFLTLTTLITDLAMAQEHTPHQTNQTTTSPRWLTFAGSKDQAPGHGRRIVLLAGDEEYRSEEAMPLLGRILSHELGFECVVLFSQDDSGEINPENLHNIPGLQLIDDADLLIVFLRFRELPDEDMAHIVDYVHSGKPVMAYRTATHAFSYRKNPESPYANWTYNSQDPSGGFGGHILGETWVAHHGHHGHEATRGVIPVDAKDHPIVRGADDIFGPTDVYAVGSLPKDTTVLVRGAILEGMNPDDQPVADERNDPMMPIAWIRERPMPDGSTQRIFVTTMGTAEDFSSTGLRRLSANAALWCVGQEGEIPPQGVRADSIGPWEPTAFGFSGHRKGNYKPNDFRDGSPWAENSASKPNNGSS